MAVLSGTGPRTDPVLGHNFLISLIDASSPLAAPGPATLSAVFDVAVGGFNECTGLDMSLEVEDYRQGGENGTVRKFPKRVTWGNITLKRGVAASTTLWDWHYGFVEGGGQRRDGLIVLMNELHLPNNIWWFRRALPIKYSGPAMNAGQSNVAIESLEFCHEGLYQVPVVGLGAAAGNPAAAAAIP